MSSGPRRKPGVSGRVAGQLTGPLLRVLIDLLRRWSAKRRTTGLVTTPHTRGTSRSPGDSGSRRSPGDPGDPGDFEGTATLTYAPRRDGRPDPGEVVWAWVPYEEGRSSGKDRPVLVVGRQDEWLLALMLTSKDHDRDAADEARHGRSWMDLGAGGWDRQGRPSEVRTDRVLRVAPQSVRREGATVDRARFEQVAAEVRRVKGW